MGSEKNYEVGRGKPPIASRFRKGQSGNPRGRPKREEKDKELDTGKLLESIDNEELYVVIDGKRKLMLKGQIHFLQSIAKAIKGDLAMARTIVGMATRYFSPDATGQSRTEFIVRGDDGKLRPLENSNSTNGSSIRSDRWFSAAVLFRRVANEEITIEVDGKRVKMTRWQALVCQIYTMALNKNNGAARLLNQMRRQFPGDILPGDPIFFIISEDDAAV